MLEAIKPLVKRLPILGPAARAVYWRLNPGSAFRSGPYWEARYRSGGTSGAGSYQRLARFKAEVLNGFVREHRIASVVEFGCGDGAQLSLAEYPRYLGYDISPTAVAMCREKFRGDRSKAFRLVGEEPPERAELALSLDVVFHLVEDAVFERYMGRLFDAAERFVIVYSSDVEKPGDAPHVRHRQFTRWVARERPEWRLVRVIPNRYPYDPGDPDHTSFAEFHIFSR